MRLITLLIFATVSIVAALVLPASAEISYGRPGGSIYDVGAAARATAAQNIATINRTTEAQSEAANRIGGALTRAIQGYTQRREALAREQRHAQEVEQQRQNEVADIQLVDVRVRGYTRKDGTYVAPHYRSNPDGNFSNNWSTKGNYNPYTGEAGTRVTPPSGRSYSGSSPSSSPSTAPVLPSTEVAAPTTSTLRTTPSDGVSPEAGNSTPEFVAPEQQTPASPQEFADEKVLPSESVTGDSANQWKVQNDTPEITLNHGITAAGSNAGSSVEMIPHNRIHNERRTSSRPGLLGKRHASAQVLVGRERAKLFASATLEATGVGWFTELNGPLIQAENVTPFGLGVDAFGSLMGMGASGTLRDSTDVIGLDGDFFGGKAGVNVFFDAADSVRPFVQLGVVFDRVEITMSDGTDSMAFPSEADNSLLFGIGAEFDINQSIAFRTSVIPDWEGTHEFTFVNELFVNSNDRWFLRLGVIAEVGAGANTVTGGIGAGIIW